MNQKLKYVGLLAVLPLFTFAFTIGHIGEADATNTGTWDGNGGQRFGSTTEDVMANPIKHRDGNGGQAFGATTKHLVCGDRLCSEPASEPEAKALDQEEDEIAAPPFFKLISVQKASANSEYMFRVILDVYAGDDNVENIKILVESDVETILTMGGSLNAGSHAVTSVKIRASDPSSIEAQVFSWDVNTGS